MAEKVPKSQKGRTRLLAGIIVVLVIAIGFLGWYILQMAPPGEKPITNAGEARERIASLQNQLQNMADDLREISESL